MFLSLALMLTILVILFIFNVVTLIIFISLPLMMVIAYFSEEDLKYFKARKLNSEVTRALMNRF